MIENFHVIFCFFSSFPDHEGYSLARKNHLTLHMLLHGIAFCLTTACIIALGIFWARKSHTIRIINGTTMPAENLVVTPDKHHANQNTFKCNVTGNTLTSLSIVTLVFCSFIHAFIITYIGINHHNEKFKFFTILLPINDDVPNKVLGGEVQDPPKQRTRIPSTRIYPSSPIMFNNPMALSPLLGCKFMYTLFHNVYSITRVQLLYVAYIV